MTHDDSPHDAGLIWSSELDGRYDVRVMRGDDADRGVLTVRDMHTGEELLREAVPVSFGAPFGPDLLDVADWQERGIRVVDARKGG